MSDEADSGKELKARIDASRRSLPIPQEDLPESYTDLARDYPLALIAGGLVTGVLIGALLPRGIGRKLARGAVAAAAVAAEVTAAYGQQAAEKAEEAGREGRKALAELGDKAGEQGRKAASAARKGGDLGIRFAREAIRIVSELRH